MQIANPSLDGVALPIGLCLDQLFAVSVGAPNQFHINAVAKTPKSVDELGQAKSELECPVSKAITNNKLTSDQKALVLDMCARYRPVFALSTSELGRCTNVEAAFPLPRDTRPIDHGVQLSLTNASMICLNGTL